MASHDGTQVLDRLLDDAEAILKTPTAANDFARRRINTSLALLAVQGIRSYLAGDHVRSAEDLATVAEEIRARHEGAESRRGETS
jgi:hypothetical protein